MPKDRGAEQGDVDGPLESSLALSMVAAEARLHVAGQQSAGIVPWVGSHSDEGMHLGGPENIQEQTNDGDILCHPVLVITI